MNTYSFINFMEYHFTIYEDDGIVQLETWTDGGVNMIITLWKQDEQSLVEQVWRYAHYGFDIDNEIDIHRQDTRYRDVFTISQSLRDFEEYENELITIADELLELSSTHQKNQVGKFAHF